MPLFSASSKVEIELFEGIGQVDKHGNQIFSCHILNAPFANHAASDNMKYKNFICTLDYYRSGWNLNYGNEKLGPYRYHPEWDECEIIGHIRKI